MMRPLTNGALATGSRLRRRPSRNRFLLIYLVAVCGISVVNIVRSTTLQVESDERSHHRVLRTKRSPTIHTKKHAVDSNGILMSTSFSDLNQNQSILFVHVGKAGGETLKEQIQMICETRVKKLKSDCHNAWANRTTAESAISKKITGYRHCDQHFSTRTQGDDRHEYTAFLWTVRNPVDRIISFFNYVNPLSCVGSKSVACATKLFTLIPTHRETLTRKLFACFSNPNDFALSLSTKTRRSTRECGRLSRQVVQANYTFENPLAHAYFNYKYYLDLTVRKHPERPIFVIRTDHLWKDFGQVDRMLGGSGFEYEGGKSQKHDRDRLRLEDTSVSREGIVNLCCALQSEILVYNELLERAVNLNPSQRNESMQALFAQCQIESLEEMPQQCVSRACQS